MSLSISIGVHVLLITPCPSFTRSLLAPCAKQEASSAYEKSLPSYEQVQRQGVGSVLLPPAQHTAHACSQPALQARAEVHRELGGTGDPPKELEAACSSWYVMLMGSGCRGGIVR